MHHWSRSRTVHGFQFCEADYAPIHAYRGTSGRAEALAHVCSCGHDLLILDEPTNRRTLTTSLVETYLTGYKGRPVRFRDRCTADKFGLTGSWSCAIIVSTHKGNYSYYVKKVPLAH